VIITKLTNSLTLDGNVNQRVTSPSGQPQELSEFLFSGRKGLCPRQQSDRGVRLSYHSNLVSKIRMGGDTPQFPRMSLRRVKGQCCFHNSQYQSLKVCTMLTVLAHSLGHCCKMFSVRLPLHFLTSLYNSCKKKPF
jgi:hypothetical protein